MKHFGWNHDGNTLASTTTTNLTIYDVRASTPKSKTIDLERHISCQLAWLSGNRVMMSTLKSATSRNLYVYDLRNTEKPISNCECTAGHAMLTPVYDPDTEMIFLYGRGTNALTYLNLENDKFICRTPYNGN